MNLLYIKRTRLNLFFLQAFIAISISESLAQSFKLPPIPAYDSVYADGKMEKTYFLNGKRVFEIGYKVGSMLYTPFFHIGGGKEDSSYAYFNGPNHESYDFYTLAKTYIIHEKFAEISRIYTYEKLRWNKSPLEKGRYYFIKENYNSNIAHNRKYKIGKWITFDSLGVPTSTIDYDLNTINGRQIKWEGKKKIIDSLIKIANKKIISVYGKEIFTKYIRLNLDRSGYYENINQSADQPGGYPLLYPIDKVQGKIELVDLSYDIVLGQERFNVIHLRISRGGTFFGKTFLESYGRDFYLCQGLDLANKGKFHPSVLNWKQIAKSKGFDLNSKFFTARMNFKPTSSFAGELSFEIDQIMEANSKKSSYSAKSRTLIINPWNGTMKESESTAGTESIIQEE